MSEVIPEGWSAHELEDLISKIEGGGTPSRTNPAFWNGQVPWATVKDLKGIRLSVTEESITEQGLSTSASRLVPANTPIIATRMAVGKVVVFDKAVAINQDLKAIYPSPRLDAEFLLYWYSAHSDQIANLATGSTVKGIRLEILRALPLTLPPLPEQQKIATILSSVDDVIEKTRAQIDKLKDLKTGMMQELLTQGIGHTEFKDSPLGRIPVSWSVGTIADLGKITTGNTPSTSNPENYDGLIPFISPGDLSDFMYIQKTKNKISKIGLAETRPLPKGSICIVCIGSTIGKTGITTAPVSATNQQINSLICTDAAPTFAYYLLTFHAVMIKSEAGTQAVPIINKSAFSSLIVQIPPYEEQVKIASALCEIDKNIAEKSAKYAQVTQLKKALMQDLLTGKVRVKLDSPEVAAA